MGLHQSGSLRHNFAGTVNGCGRLLRSPDRCLPSRVVAGIAHSWRSAVLNRSTRAVRFGHSFLLSALPAAWLLAACPASAGDAPTAEQKAWEDKLRQMAPPAPPAASAPRQSIRRSRQSRNEQDRFREL
jgi:hypothetical protein